MEQRTRTGEGCQAGGGVSAQPGRAESQHAIPCVGYRGERRFFRAHRGVSMTMSAASACNMWHHLLVPSRRGIRGLPHSVHHCTERPCLPLTSMPDRQLNQPASQHSLPATTHMDFEHGMPENQNLQSYSLLAHWHGIGCSWLHLDSSGPRHLGVSHCLENCVH